MALSWALHSAAALSADSLLYLPRPGLLGGEWQALGGGVGGGGSEEQAGPALCRLCTGGGDQPHTTEVPTATHAAETWFLFRSLLLSLGF